MAQNIFVFSEEDVIVLVPKKYRGHDIIVDKKDPDLELFERTVINLLVTYEGANGEAISRLRPPMEIWVGYEDKEENLDLSYWDGRAKVNMAEAKVENRHKKKYKGYGHALVTEWPADPNLGWG